MNFVKFHYKLVMLRKPTNTLSNDLIYKNSSKIRLTKNTLVIVKNAVADNIVIANTERKVTIFKRKAYRILFKFMPDFTQRIFDCSLFEPNIFDVSKMYDTKTKINSILAGAAASSS